MECHGGERWSRLRGMLGSDTSVNMSQYHVYTVFTLLKKTSEFTYPSSSPWFGPFYVSNPLMAGTSLDGRIIL